METLVSKSAAHAVELAAGAASRHEVVVACGGDGLVAFVANGVIGTGASLGIVPLGSGNDFAVHVGYPRHDPVAACAIVAGGTARAVDVGRIEGGRAFLCVAGAGFDSETNEAANRIRWARGTAVYVAAVLQTLARFRPAEFTLRIDGTEERFPGMFVAVGNARSYGGGMLITPDARLDDGLFDVCMVRALSRPALLGQFPRIFRGTHIHHPAVRIVRGSDVTLDADRPFTLYADGEPAGHLPVRLSVEPGALVVVGP